MRWLILAFAAIPALAAWATIAFLGTARGWWTEELAPAGDHPAMIAALKARLAAESRGAAALQVLAGGQPVEASYLSSGAPVGPDSRFQMASVSKWFTAWGVMTLVEDGRVDLDAPVSTYLSRWRLPDGPFDNDEVTVRRLLSHSAGLTDGLGYLGFEPGQPVQPLEASLTRASDAMPGADGRVQVGIEPGTEWRYSGGGYALLQLLIEEVSGQPFARFMRQQVLQPLNLQNSAFDDPDPVGLAPNYASDGSPLRYRRFAAPAAAGLFASPADLATFVAAQLPGADGAPAGRGVLRPETLRAMNEPQASVMGTDVWGLGVVLYAGNGHGGHVIGHDGSNDPAINTTVRFDPATGDGIVLLVTGHPTLASDLGGDWVLWHTGTMDVATFYASIGDVIRRVAIGWLVIAALVVIIGWRVNRGQAGRPPARTINGEQT